MTTLLGSPAARPRWSVSPAGPLCPESIVELTLGTRHLATLPWGRFDGFGTAAYWVAQTLEGRYAAPDGFGNSLAHEVCFCLLGGYGVTAEMNDAAYAALLAADLVRVEPAPDPSEIEGVLRRPLEVRGHGRRIHYRFPNQRAVRLSGALRLLGSRTLPSDPVELRDALLSFTGIGPKTASWIVRNHTGSGEVAIVDVHLRRAGLAAGFFGPGWHLPQDYVLFEAAFLAYADVGGVPAGELDLCIWDQVRRLGRAASKILRPASSLD